MLTLIHRQLSTLRAVARQLEEACRAREELDLTEAEFERAYVNRLHRLEKSEPDLVVQALCSHQIRFWVGHRLFVLVKVHTLDGGRLRPEDARTWSRKQWLWRTQLRLLDEERPGMAPRWGSEERPLPFCYLPDESGLADVFVGIPDHVTDSNMGLRFLHYESLRAPELLAPEEAIPQLVLPLLRRRPGQKVDQGSWK